MKLKALTPVALLLFAGAAVAQDGATPREQYNQKAATGAAQSEANAQGGAHANFATADTDKDGRLSVAELQVVMPDLTIEDTDADGYISQSEAEASISGLSLEGDGNDITETEYEAIVALRGNPGAAGAGAGFNAGRGNGADGVPPSADDLEVDVPEDVPEADLDVEAEAGTDN